MPHQHTRPAEISVTNADEIEPSADSSALAPSQQTHSRHRFSPMALLTPRTPNYEQIEAGRARSGSNPYLRRKNWWTWRKFAIGAVALIAIVYFFGPRETLGESGPLEAFKKWKEGHHSQDENLPIYEPEDVDVHEEMSSSPAASHPKTFEEDKEPSMSTYCPGESGKVQWGLMIDAGSTGSRIHVYKFNTCKSTKSPVYEYEIFKMMKPGLSSFADSPDEAAKSLDVLLDTARESVPESLQKCTPVAVKATAGLRLLGADKSKAILAAVRKRLETVYPFPVIKGDSGVGIMDGKDEGVYAWITANYLLGTVGGDKNAKSSYAVLDLGGASTQIVFKPSFPTTDTKMEPGEHKYDLDFVGQKHELYQHSYLGYGLMRARASVHDVVDFMGSLRLSKEEKTKFGTKKVANPCIAQGLEREIDLGGEDESHKTLMQGLDVGSFEACRRVVELVLGKDSVCETKPCSFNGVYQPSLLESFSSGNVLLLSYFYDRLAQLLPPGHTALEPTPESKKSGVPSKHVKGSNKKHPKQSSDEPLTVGSIANLASIICKGPSEWKKHWGKDVMGAEDSDGKPQTLWHELDDRPEWCLDLTFMYGLLRLGYEFPDEQPVYLGKRIEGTELGWALGAGIEMVGGAGIECRV